MTKENMDNQRVSSQETDAMLVGVILEERMLPSRIDVHESAREFAQERNEDRQAKLGKIARVAAEHTRFAARNKQANRFAS